MQFTDDKERITYFARLANDPHLVPFGAAMEHAESAKLGVWSQRSDLMTDCGMLMCAELVRYARYGFALPCGGSQLYMVIVHSVAFMRMFSAARRKDDLSLALALEELGTEAKNEALLKEAAMLRRFHALNEDSGLHDAFGEQPPYYLVASEISTRPFNLERLKDDRDPFSQN